VQPNLQLPSTKSQKTPTTFSKCGKIPIFNKKPKKFSKTNKKVKIQKGVTLTEKR
jgi:hypothetical protein